MMDRPTRFVLSRVARASRESEDNLRFKLFHLLSFSRNHDATAFGQLR